MGRAGLNRRGAKSRRSIIPFGSLVPCSDQGERQPAGVTRCADMLQVRVHRVAA